MRYTTLVMLCDSTGQLKSMLINHYPQLKIEPGQNWFQILNPSDHEMAQHTFLNIASQSEAMDVEFVLNFQQAAIPVFLYGNRIADAVLLKAESELDDICQYYSKIEKLDADTISKIRAMYEGKTGVNERDPNYIRFLEDLSRVNNELITYQRELNKKNAELAKLNELKNQFVGMAAHDLRNPLGIISNYTRFLIEDLQNSLDDTQKEFMDIILSTSNYMLKLVEGILDLTYIQSGKIKLTLQRFDLDVMLKDFVPLQQSLAKRKDIQVVYTGLMTELWVEADSVKIRQVLSNLIGNAIKYSPANTLILIQPLVQGSFVTIKITDQGPGVPEADLERIFEPFQKSSLTLNPDEPSTGLGLTITRNIILAHHGKIWVESTMGKGSSFFVALPLAKD
ncbi:MAG: HAMP domain-containing sensor histidine kinase [Candidatus Cloacimonetes bacterium]|nr:HAMP domain-containing sensor histidine kinase [Candidatus Cloacimonadota bacterium]